MTSFDNVLWHALATMRIAPAGSALDFEARLAQEQGWNAAFTGMVMLEYRRFLYLAATAGAVTPSKAVDAAWHLHLTYTRHYWDELCGRILGRPLHHEPSGGGREEERRFEAQYRDTLRRYRAAFGVDAPAEIWPDPDDRPPAVSRQAALGTLAGATLVVAACGPAVTARNDLWLGLTLLIAAFVGFAIILALARYGSKGKGGGSCGTSGCGGGGGDGCGGGCGGD